MGVTFRLCEAFSDVGMGLRFLAIAWGNLALLACPMFSSVASCDMRARKAANAMRLLASGSGGSTVLPAALVGGTGEAMCSRGKE